MWLEVDTWNPGMFYEPSKSLFWSHCFWRVWTGLAGSVLFFSDILFQRYSSLRESIPRLLNEGTVKWGDDSYDRLLCPGLQPGPPSQTPGGLGQRYWSWAGSHDRGNWSFGGDGLRGPSSLMMMRCVTKLQNHFKWFQRFGEVIMICRSG